MIKIISALFVLLLIASSVFADSYESLKSNQFWESFTYPEQINIPSQKSGDDACLLFNHTDLDTVYSFNSGWEYGDQIISYFDPSSCGTPTYPFEITSVDFFLLAQNATYDWPIFIEIVVYDLQVTGDKCFGPGEELYRQSVLCDEATFAFPDPGNVILDSVLCVDGPFFFGIKYGGFLPAKYPSVVFDYNLTPDTCDVFYWICCDWYGSYGYWVTPPGYPFFWINGETQSLSCCDDLDADLVCDETDNCPGLANNDQADADNDGIGDLCDDCPDDPNNDQDNDGYCANDDNCPYHRNPLQEDSDFDGIGDSCEVYSGCVGLRGNIDGYLNDACNVADLTYYVNFVFKGGPPPPSLIEADVNNDGEINVTDLVYLVNYIFKGGPAPAPC